MLPRNCLEQWIAPALLLCGMVAAFVSLAFATTGSHVFLALSAGALVFGFCRAGFSSRSPWPWFALAASMGLVLVTAAIPAALGSGLAWSVLAIAILFAIRVLQLSSSVVVKESCEMETVPVILPVNPSVEAIAERAEVPAVSSEPIPFSLVQFESEEEFEDLECEEDCEEEEFEEAGERVLQAWTRRRHAEEERLEGSVVAEFHASQKQVYIHVPFLPGFVSRPQAFCMCEPDQIFYAEFDILQTYGGRLTVRRHGNCDEPAEVSVSFSITAPTISRSAA